MRWLLAVREGCLLGSHEVMGVWVSQETDGVSRGCLRRKGGVNNGLGEWSMIVVSK